MFVAAVVMVGLSVASGEVAAFSVADVSSRSWWASAYLAVVGSISVLALLWLSRNTPSSVASSFAYASPVVALALSAALLGEDLGIVEVLAALCALAGVALMVGRR